jgi:hypothetical protein
MNVLTRLKENLQALDTPETAVEREGDTVVASPLSEQG